jgi:hypothetical protein
VAVSRVAPGLLLAVVGFGTPPPGTEIEAGGGIGAYHYGGGCDGPHNFAHYQALQLRARHLDPTGLVVAAEASGQRGTVDSTDGAATEIGRHNDLYLLALRVGYEGRFGGVEGGPAYGRPFADGNATFLPSLKLWLGRYGVVHGWASVAADRTLAGRVAGIGVGHTSEHLKISLGLAGSAGNDGTTIADVDVNVSGGVWVGAGAQFADTGNTWGAMLRVGFFFGPEPPPAPRPGDGDERLREPPAVPRAAVPIEEPPVDGGVPDEEQPSVTPPLD